VDGDADADADARLGTAREVAETTFRVKMEKLGDRNSTNLYFEGWTYFIFFGILGGLPMIFFGRLPLSIDEPVCIDFFYDLFES
jgi:hypothetical protein